MTAVTLSGTPDSADPSAHQRDRAAERGRAAATLLAMIDGGAALSHAIIVSRELGIPCVVSATNATRRIPDGALARVDGTTGMVTLLE